MAADFQVGTFRALALWGGRAARQLIKMEYPRMLVDNRVYDMALESDGVELVKAMGFNWVFLMCSWGFPSETEEADWDAFRRAVRLYHAANIKVCGGVQVASYVREGTYWHKTWHAVDPWGKRIPVATGRFLTCWRDPDWHTEVQHRIGIAVNAEADGVFFSAPWAGHRPGILHEGWLGDAGCHCERCQEAYRSDMGGHSLPRAPIPGRSKEDPYWRWYGGNVQRQLAEWAKAAQEIRPDITIAFESGDSTGPLPVTSPGNATEDSALTHGVHLVSGRWLSTPSGRSVPQNASSLGIATAIQKSHHVTSYIGPQRPASATRQRFLVAAGEASAVGMPLTLVGADYEHSRGWSTLLSGAFSEQRRALGQANSFLQRHSAWLNQREHCSPLAIYYPQGVQGKRQREADWAFGAACMTLIQHGLPLRIVGEEAWSHVSTVIVPPGDAPGLDSRLQTFVGQGGRVIALRQPRPGTGSRPVWRRAAAPRARLYELWGMRRVAYRGMVLLRRAYYTRPPVHLVLGRLIQRRDARPSAACLLPPTHVQTELVRAVGQGAWPQVEGQGPLLLTMYREGDGSEQWHLVNYSDQPQRVTLHTPRFVSGWVFAPTNEQAAKVFGSALIVTVDDYKVIRIAAEKQMPGG